MERGVYRVWSVVLAVVATVGCTHSLLAQTSKPVVPPETPEIKIVIPPEIQSRARLYLDLWVNGDYQSMYNLLDKRTREQISFQQFLEAFTLRVPLSDEPSFFAPKAVDDVTVEREDATSAEVKFTLVFSKEGYLGKRLVQMMDRRYRATASNAERYRLRQQAVLLMSELYNPRSPYVSLSACIRVAVSEERLISLVNALTPQARINDIVVSSLPLSTGADEHDYLRWALGYEELHLTHAGTPVAISFRNLLLVKEEGQWRIANAVVPVSDEVRHRWLSTLSTLTALPPLTVKYQNGSTFGPEAKIFLLAEALGLLD